MTHFDRPRGTLVKSLDRDALTTLLVTKYPTLDAGAKADRNALVFTDKGYATLHTEGVGYFANEDGTYSVSVWHGVSHYWLDVELDDLLALPYEEEDLADYIRNHNDRLENNFYTWRAVIKQEVTA